MRFRSIFSLSRTVLGVALLWFALPGIAWLQPVASPTPPALAGPRSLVEDFYSWIFQVKSPLPWQEVVRQRRGSFTALLAATLIERSLRGGLDVDPFLDSDGKASGYEILGSEQRARMAMVSVRILDTSTGLRSRDRIVVVELESAASGWHIANFHYQWARTEDLLSLCRRQGGLRPP